MMLSLRQHHTKSLNQIRSSRNAVGVLLGLFLRLCKGLRILRDTLRALNIVLACMLVVDREVALDALCKPLSHL